MSMRSEPAAEHAAHEHRPTTALLTDLVHHVTELVRKEVQLLRAEINEKMQQAFSGIGMIVAGMVLGLVAANALVAALIGALADWGLATGWAALIVGVAIALIGFGLINSGIKTLKNTKLTPERTTRSLQQDATVAKDSMK